MKNKNDKICGKGWRIAKRIQTAEILTVRNFDKNSNRLNWHCLDLSTGKEFDLPLSSQSVPGNPIFLSQAETLLYTTSKGLVGYDFGRRTERLLFPIDTDLYRIQRIWLSPKNESALFYILCRDLSSPPTEEELESQGVVLQEAREEYELFEWKIGSPGPKSIIKFGNPPVFSDIDWNQYSLFASLGNSKELIKINLATHEVTPLGRQKSLVGLTVSPSNTFVTWDSDLKSRIEETPADGRKVTLASSGGYPAFSPNGQKMAFIRSYREIWLRNKNGGIEMIMAFPKFKTNWAEIPTWCSCGAHFAVCLTQSKEKSERRILVIADTKEKKLLLVDGLSLFGVFGIGEMVWLPRSVVLGVTTRRKRELKTRTGG
ncbi:MAG: hypothetical protein HY922_14185 [Elusimicrobia bacterium]|nr:hypothetical protein [Elusimicrobiota bacterium]